MFSTTSKRLLISHIKHADTHNRIVEEQEMWKSYSKLKEKGMETKYSYLDDKREDMGVEFSNRSDRRAHMDDEPLPVAKARGKDCTFWMRQLQKVEEADPERWGHNGFKELYPNDFNSDQSDIQDNKKKSKKKKKEKKNKHKKSNCDSDDKKPRKSAELKHRKKFQNYKSRNSSKSLDDSDSDDDQDYKHKKHKRKHKEKRSHDKHHKHRRKNKSKHSKRSRSRSPHSSERRSRSPRNKYSNDSNIKSTKRKRDRHRDRSTSSSSSSSETEDENYIKYKKSMKNLADYVSNGGLTVTKNRHRKVPKRTSKNSSDSVFHPKGDKYFTVSESEGEMDSF